MKKNLFLLAGAFFLIFFWFASVQQFITSYFSENWYPDAWFHSLLLIYGWFMMGSLFLWWFIKKIGSKNSMLYSSFMYGLFVFTLITDSLILLYFSSFFLWVAASFLWIWQQSYIISDSWWKEVWKNLSIVHLFVNLWAWIGSFVLWQLVSFSWYDVWFAVFASLPIFAMVFIYFLDNYDGTSKWTAKKLAIFWYMKNIDLLRLWFFNFSITFVSGVFFSIVPLHIKETLWIASLGMIASFYYFMVMWLAFHFWKIVDRFDNQKLIFLLIFGTSLSMLSFYFYTSGALFIYIWVIILAFIAAFMASIMWSIINKVSSGWNVKYLSSFFFVFSNFGIVTWILVSSYVKSNTIYWITSCLLILSAISYTTLYKKSFDDIKGGIE